MRAVIQRATSGEVRVDGTVVGRLALDPHEAGERQGLVVLLGVQRGDGPEQVATVARKIVETGQFGAMMEVSLVNDGPFTVLVEA